jgi:hypothetical protein
MSDNSLFNYKNFIREFLEKINDFLIQCNNYLIGLNIILCRIGGYVKYHSQYSNILNNLFISNNNLSISVHDLMLSIHTYIETIPVSLLDQNNKQLLSVMSQIMTTIDNIKSIFCIDDIQKAVCKNDVKDYSSFVEYLYINIDTERVNQWQKFYSYAKLKGVDRSIPQGFSKSMPDLHRSQFYSMSNLSLTSSNQNFENLKYNRVSDYVDLFLWYNNIFLKFDTILTPYLLSQSTIPLLI